MTDDIFRCQKCGHDAFLYTGQTNSSDWMTYGSTITESCAECGDIISQSARDGEVPQFIQELIKDVSEEDGE